MVVAVAGFLVVILAGAAIIFSQSTQYSATTTVVVLPDQSVGVDAASNYYDTLSHGQIAATASHILGLKQFKTEADRQLHLNPDQVAASKIQVRVEAGTSLLSVTATAPSKATAEHLADAVVNGATSTVNGLSRPYQLSVVSGASNTAQLTSNLSLGKFLAVLVIVALACAIGAQQAFNQLVDVRHRRLRGAWRPDDAESAGRVAARRGRSTAPPPAPLAGRRSKIAPRPTEPSARGDEERTGPDPSGGRPPVEANGHLNGSGTVAPIGGGLRRTPSSANNSDGSESGRG